MSSIMCWGQSKYKPVFTTKKYSGHCTNFSNFISALNSHVDIHLLESRPWLIFGLFYFYKSYFLPADGFLRVGNEASMIERSHTAKSCFLVFFVFFILGAKNQNSVEEAYVFLNINFTSSIMTKFICWRQLNERFAKDESFS